MPSTAYPLASAYLPPGATPGGVIGALPEDAGNGLQSVIKQLMEDGASIQRRSMRIKGDLEAETGTLGRVKLRGDSEVLTGGKFRSGQTAYDTGTGYYLDYNAGTPRLSLGNSAGSKMTWDGTSLAVTGVLTATSGNIGGWTIGATTITGGSVTLDSAGNIRSGQTAYDTGTGFWLGVDGGSAKFSAGNAAGSKMTWNGTVLAITGDVTATGGVIGGWTVNGSTDLNAQSGNVVLNAASGLIRAGATSYAAGTGWILEYNAGTPRFRVGTATSGANYIAFDGTNIEFRGKIIDGDGSFWDSTGITLISSGVFGDAIKWKNGSTDIGSIYAGTSDIWLASAASMGTIITANNGGDSVTMSPSTFIDFTIAGANIFRLLPTDRAASFYGRLYPGTGSGTQSTGYISWDSGTSRIYVNAAPLAVGYGIYPGDSGSIQNSVFFRSAGTHFDVILGDAAGASLFRVMDSGGVQQFGIDSNGVIGLPGNNGAALGAYAGKVPVSWNGGNYFIPVYA